MSFWQWVAFFIGGCILSVATSVGTMELLIYLNR